MKKKSDIVANVPEFPLIDEKLLKTRIYTIRGVKVMLDSDLAEIYGYSTKAFNQQVKNNIEKFAEFADSGRVVVFDTETTGGSCSDEICQLAAAEYVNGRLERTMEWVKV